MNIRSITYFMVFDELAGHAENPVEYAGKFTRSIREKCIELGYNVQSIRLATSSFARSHTLSSQKSFVELVTRLERRAIAAGFDYLSLGPATPDLLESYQVIPECLSQTENTFFSGIVSSSRGGISLPAIKACGKVIEETSTIEPNGFGNLYFAALVNVPPGAPFFPAAYHEEVSPAFAFAMEAADLAVKAFSTSGSLEEARANLIEEVEKHAVELSSIAEKMSEGAGVEYRGIDFTLAPFAEQEKSLGTAIELLGVPAVGLHGSLAAAAFITDAMDRANYKKTGFNGLMLPLLEDATLARRASENQLSVKDLLMYSAVCGTGLDTIPLPGDTTADQLSAILLDLAALGQRLNKPLTARLMPIPGKSAGEMTDFDFAYFANSRVLRLDAQPLKGLFSGDESFRLGQR